MVDNEKQHMLGRLAEIQTMLYKVNEAVWDFNDRFEEYDEPEEVTSESNERESLPDDTPVGHGWVMVWGDSDLFRPHINSHFTWWLDDEVRWGYPGNWHESDLRNSRPATVGDLRRVGLPISEWPEITASEPEPEVEPSEVTSESDEREDPYPDWQDGEIRIGTFGDIAKRYGDSVHLFEDRHGFVDLPYSMTGPFVAESGFRAIDEEWSGQINKKAMEAMVENVVYELAKAPGSAGFIAKHEGEIYYAFYSGAWIPALDWQASQPRAATFCDAWRDMTSDPLGFGVHDWAKP